MTPDTFIPQAAERPPARSPRMPKFEELPMPAQAEIRQARGEVEEDHPQKGRMSLLQRLANVGLGRRDEESEPPIAARSSGPAMPPLPKQPRRTGADQNRRVSRYPSMRDVRLPKVWTLMDARHLLRRRHRVTTILISPPSCAVRRPEVCYNSDERKGPGLASRDLHFLSGTSPESTRQAIGFKSLIIFSRDPMAASMVTQRAAIWLSFGANAAQIG